MIGYVKPVDFTSQDIDWEYDYITFGYVDEDTGAKKEVSVPLGEFIVDIYGARYDESEAKRIALEHRHEEIIRQEQKRLWNAKKRLTGEQAIAELEVERLRNDPDAFEGSIEEHEYDLSKAEENVCVLKERLTIIDKEIEWTKKTLCELTHLRTSDTIEQRIEAMASIEKDKDGNTYYCVDYNNKHLKAETLEKLRIMASIEEDRANEKNDDPNITNRSAEVIKKAKEQMTELTAAQSVYVLEMFYQAVFGESSERKLARESINKILELHEEHKRLRDKDAAKKLQEITDIETGSIDDFYRYLYDDIYTYRKHTMFDLAIKVGYSDASGISRILNKETKRLNRDKVVRLALAMELPKEDLIKCIRSAGFAFPQNQTDYAILSLIDRGIKDYDIITDKLYRFESKF